ncbi:MAG: hypothetical protein WD872_16355 [Pirellulaceae bacterium]
MTTRDQLISDWRRQLAAAEEVAAGQTGQAWLARMKVRLYQFLLACYGRGDWSADGLDDGLPPSADESPAELFDRAAEHPLTGKAARSPAAIRSVLKAVAAAHEQAAPGPLAAGLGEANWVIVAAASSKLKVRRAWQLLRAAGLHPRVCYRGDDHMVEVPAAERQAAFAVVEQNREWIHQPKGTPRTQRVPLWGRFSAGALVALWFAVPLTWMLLAYVSLLATPADTRPPLASFFTNAEFLRIWGTLFLLGLLVVCLHFARQNRPPKSAAKPARR